MGLAVGFTTAAGFTPFFPDEAALVLVCAKAAPDAAHKPKDKDVIKINVLCMKKAFLRDFTNPIGKAKLSKCFGKNKKS
jgi:hypothetical protein